MEFSQAWPWYVAGPLVGLVVPALLLIGNKTFGISSSLRHICAATIPSNAEYFNYDWRSKKWNLIFVLGLIIGGAIAMFGMGMPIQIELAKQTTADLTALGITDFSGLVPSEIFGFQHIFSLSGFTLLIVGGFLVGFGTRYAGGCTSGHAISGLSNLQLPSLFAVLGFFAGGLITTHLLLPFLLK